MCGVGDIGGVGGVARYDLHYMEGFMTVLHTLITLITAPGARAGSSAEAWVIPHMIRILESRAPHHQRVQVRHIIIIPCVRLPFLL